jgi:hypothetical protein
MKSMNLIASSIDKLPNRDEYDEVRKQLAMTSDLKLSKEEVENFKEVLKRGAEGGMYG